MTYLLSALLIEANFASDEAEALELIPDVTVNGHPTKGLANPGVIPDDDGNIALEYEGGTVTLEGK